jgi:hypothetical protein
MKRIIFLFFLSGWSVAYGQCSGGFCANVQISGMAVDVDDAFVWVQTSGTETSLNCTPTEGVYLKLDTGTQGGMNVYAALLSVQARGAVATFRIQDNVSPCRVVWVSPK